MQLVVPSFTTAAVSLGGCFVALQKGVYGAMFLKLTQALCEAAHASAAEKEDCLAVVPELTVLLRHTWIAKLGSPDLLFLEQHHPGSLIKIGF